MISKAITNITYFTTYFAKQYEELEAKLNASKVEVG